jgi:hypothetical protein
MTTLILSIHYTLYTAFPRSSKFQKCKSWNNVHGTSVFRKCEASSRFIRSNFTAHEQNNRKSESCLIRWIQGSKKVLSIKKRTELNLSEKTHTSWRFECSPCDFLKFLTLQCSHLCHGATSSTVACLLTCWPADLLTCWPAALLMMRALSRPSCCYLLVGINSIYSSRQLDVFVTKEGSQLAHMLTWDLRTRRLPCQPQPSG